MGNAMHIAKVSARGGFNLFWGLIASNMISAAAVIIVARMLSPEEYGLVKVASTAPGLLVLFRDWGMSAAIIRYIAQHRSENNSSGIKTTILAGSSFLLALGFALCLVCFFLSELLAVQVFKRADIVYLIRVASLTIFAGSLVSISEAVFIGFEAMNYRSFILVSQALLKLLLSPLLILLGLGVIGPILGVVLSTLLAGLIGFTLLYLHLYKRLPGQIESLSQTGNSMLRYGIPLFISSIAGGLLTQFNNFLMAAYCSDQAIGNYSVALNFTVLISFFSQPIATVLFPAFSKLSSEKDKRELAVVFRQSVRYATLLVVPVAAAIMVLSQQAVFTLFGSKYVDAPLYLSLLCFGSLYTALGSLSISSFINSRGKTEINMKLGLANTLVGFPLCLVLVSKFQITGLICAGLISTAPSVILGLWLVKKYWGVTIELDASAKVIAASAVAALATYIVVSILILPYWMLLFGGGLLFFIVYAAMTPIVGAVTKGDLKNLQEMFKEFDLLSSILSKPISLMEKLTRK